MWLVYEHHRVSRQLAKLPVHVLKRYEKWKDIVSISGLSGVRAIKGLHDQPLQGDWKGFRSSRLGDQHRVIYKIEKGEVLVEVVSITAHDYRRKS